MGADLVFSIERDRAAALRLAFVVDGPEAVLHVVRGAVYGELVSVRAGAEPRRVGAVPHPAGRGGGGLQPSEQAILNDTFPLEKRGMAFAVYGIAVVVAPTIGPWLGGWITDNFSWRWIFYINVPVGMVSLLLTNFLVSDPPYMKKASVKAGFRIDYIGIGLISLGLGSMQIILDKGQREDWLSSDFIRIFFVLMIIGIVAGIIWELREKEPVVDLRMLKERNFAIATLAMFFLGFVMYSSTVLIPQLL